MNPITIRCGGYQKPASIHNQAARRFGELLQQKLGDRIAFELIGNVLDLGRQSGDLPHMVENGELECCYISTVRFAEQVPELKLVELPFVVKNREVITRALEGEYGARIRTGMNTKTAFRLLGIWDNGFRHLSNKVRAIRTPADCRGLRIRTQISKLHVEVFAALGFEPIPVDVKEFVEQITTERFQAQDNPLTNIYNFGVHHHHRYLTLTGHFWGATAFVCNANVYARWPADVRQAVDEAARAATLYQRELAAAEDADILDKLDPAENEVIHLTSAEHKAFFDAVRPVLDKHRGDIDPALFAYLEG